MDRAKKILITGGAGFIGSNLVQVLGQRFPESHLLVMDHGDAEHKTLPPAEFYREDIAKKESLDKLRSFQPEVIFHLAATTDTRVKDPSIMNRNNVLGFQNILKLARLSNSIVVYASSAAVYGINSTPLSEDSPLQPANIYGESKVAMEKLAALYGGKCPGLKLVGLRYFNVYGPGEDHKKDYASMISQLIWKIQAGKNPRLFKYGEQKRDFIYVRYVVDFTIDAASAPASDVFNVGTGQPASFNEVLEIINQCLGTEIKAEYIENPYSFFQPHTQAVMNKAKNKLNFTPRYDIVTGIRDYLQNSSSYGIQ
jgi:ADP-L-glycero-D-manno-heptose 6-epimerase